MQKYAYTTDFQRSKCKNPRVREKTAKNKNRIIFKNYKIDVFTIKRQLRAEIFHRKRFDTSQIGVYRGTIFRLVCGNMKTANGQRENNLQHKKHFSCFMSRLFFKNASFQDKRRAKAIWSIFVAIEHDMCFKC